MRGDDELGVLAASDGDGDRRRETASGAAAVDDLPDGANVDGVALEGFDESLLELGGAGGVEDLQKSGGGATDVVAALGDDAKERLAGASGAGEPIEAAMLARAPFLVGEPVEMLGLLDLLAAVPGARMRGDDVVAVGDAHLIEIG